MGRWYEVLINKFNMFKVHLSRSFKEDIKLLLLVFIAVFSSSCKKDHWLDCLKSSGKTITVQRALSYYNSIELNNNIDLVFHSGATGFTEVSGGANIIDG